MQALRLILEQNSANYRKEETINCRMTYPLPPFSTVIGAIHEACGYTEYKPMDLSIQGSYESMRKKPYTDYCFLDNVMNDRGMLVKMKSSSYLSTAFDKVAVAKKATGNDFRKNITIQIYNDQLLKEYQQLKDLADEIKKIKDSEIKPKLARIKDEKSKLAQRKKELDKTSDEYKSIVAEEKRLKDEEKKINDDIKAYELEDFTKPYSLFRSLTTSLRFYEVLDNIRLIIHIRAEEKVLEDILSNIYNLKSIGRSEDFVRVLEAKIVNLDQNDDCEISSNYSAYLSYYDVMNENILTKEKQNRTINGTMYYLNKKYQIIDGQRIFDKEKVIYASEYAIEETSDNVWLDNTGEEKYIVNFI